MQKPKSRGKLASLKTLEIQCVLVQPDGWARGEREGYGEPCDVTSLSLGLSLAEPGRIADALPTCSRYFFSMPTYK